jgi:hypothetical protein
VTGSRPLGTGRAVEHGQSTWTSRYLYRYKAVHLLHRCGFHVAALVGDYHDGPVTDAGQLVFDARLNMTATHPI